MADPVDVLDYWIGEVGEAGWFDGDEGLDAEIRERFLDLWQAANQGGLDHWVDGSVGTLAYLVLCDQMSRNMHRGKPEAFATDERALAAARRAIEEGWDMAAPEPERMFFYLPFEHSEDLSDQARSVRLMAERLPLDPEMTLHARAHQEIIKRFGRFPYRNAALGRVDTPAEAEFLASGGYGAIVEAMRPSHVPDA